MRLASPFMCKKVSGSYHFPLQVMGKVMKTVPNRDSSHKHYLPSKFYPLNIFPKHLSGSGYVLSMSVVPILYECMLRTPFMNLEDVMLTGLCATTQMGLKLTDNALFRAKKPTIGPEYVCFYKKSAFVSIALILQPGLGSRLGEKIHGNL